MNVFDIIKKYLIDNGYDGLCCQDCGCGVDDLVPCDDDFSQCVPAYKKPCNQEECPNPDECEWYGESKRKRDCYRPREDKK